MIEQKAFGEAILFTVSGPELAVSISSRGATVVSLRYRGRESILGYDSDEGYLRGTGYLGATVGRVGNRIGGSAFVLDGLRYALTPNEGPNQLHGGPDAFDKRLWTPEVLGEDALRFTLLSPDGDNGFPGTLRAAVTYRVTGAVLRIVFEGESDRDTVYAPTDHMYFDLSGRGCSLDASLWLGADRVVEPGPGLIPTGRLLPAEGAFDFSALRKVGRDYDHAFVLTGEHACRLEDGGVALDIYTDFPALQVYTGAFLAEPHRPRQGLALEPEFFPDSPNQPGFPSVVLRPGEHFVRWAEYRFSTAD
ncbi:MAG: galactose mutarotase [Oscillospiraceae bacterium]|nr:galactose mutarotase [Oscillospiraceae bacterium]